METLRIIKRIYQQYNGTGAHMILFWICLMILFISVLRKKNSKKKKLLLICLGILVIFSCPLTAHIIILYCIEAETYWRMLWMLPVPLIIAYVMTEEIWNVKIKENWIRCILSLGFVWIIILTGTPVLSDLNFTKASGLEKLPNYVVEICHVLEESAEKNQDTNKCVLAEDTLVPYLRQYDGSIRMPYGRSVMRGLKKMKLFNELNDPECDYNRLTKLALKKGCNYMVLYTERFYDSKVPNGTCKYIAQIENYTVYQLL